MHSPLLTPQIHAYLAYEGAAASLHRRLETSRHRAESGEVTSQMILVAVFAALAIAVGAIVYTKTFDKASSIPTDTNFTDAGNPGGGGGGGGG